MRSHAFVRSRSCAWERLEWVRACVRVRAHLVDLEPKDPRDVLARRRRRAELAEGLKEEVREAEELERVLAAATSTGARDASERRGRRIKYSVKAPGAQHAKSPDAMPEMRVR
eukprot:1162928-Pleurochrysis_carterae.AAC.1